MIKLSTTQLWVHDQDEALAFYTDKLGMELRDDVTVPEMGNFRWLTVGLPGEDTAITLMAVPGQPVFEEETRRQIHELLAKGASGGLFFSPAAGLSFHPTPRWTLYASLNEGMRAPTPMELTSTGKKMTARR